MAGHSFHRDVVRAREVTPVRSLDLDDTRAEVGELPRRERTGDSLFDRDNSDALEWWVHCLDSAGQSFTLPQTINHEGTKTIDTKTTKIRGL